MHKIGCPPFPSESEFDRVATRHFVVPSVQWAVGLLAIVLSASLSNAAEPTADAGRSEAATVAYGA
jgi:hypothetical protein